MGSTPEKKKQEEAMDRYRKEVLSLFNGQTFLLIGDYGVGKSSFINTVNHEIRLSTNPYALFHEVADTSPAYDWPATRFLKTYTKDHGLFPGVNFSKDQIPIKFIDTCGMSGGRQDRMGKLQTVIVRLVRGQIAEGTDLERLTQTDHGFDESSVEASYSIGSRCSSIIFFVSSYDNVCSSVAKAVANARDICQQKQLRIEVFCVITRADYPEIDLESMTDDLAQLLRISEIRIKPVINYTPRDIRSDMTTVLNMEKQKLALEAMLCFLLHSTEPAFSSLPAIPVSEAKCSSSPDVPSAVKDGDNSKVTEAQLDAVARIAKDKWREIGHHLGFKMVDLDEYEERETKRLHCRLFRLLVDWKRKVEDPTVGDILLACQKSGVGGEVKRALQAPEYA